MTREYKQLFEATAGMNVDLAVHSQASIHANNAMSALAGTEMDFSNFHIEYNGAAVSRGTSIGLVKNIGAKFTGFNVNPGDFVPVGVGHNFLMGEGLGYAVRRFPDLFESSRNGFFGTGVSPHSYYIRPQVTVDLINSLMP